MMLMMMVMGMVMVLVDVGMVMVMLMVVAMMMVMVMVTVTVTGAVLEPSPSHLESSSRRLRGIWSRYGASGAVLEPNGGAVSEPSWSHPGGRLGAVLGAVSEPCSVSEPSWGPARSFFLALRRALRSASRALRLPRSGPATRACRCVPRRLQEPAGGSAVQ